MAIEKMHSDELEINEGIVKKLIQEQFPDFENLQISKVHSIGTVNAIYKLGDEFYVRLPRVEKWTLDVEWQVLPIIEKKVSLTVPEIIAKGRPNTEYPLDWGIYRWIQGATYDSVLVDETEAAETLALFINEMRSIEIPNDAPKAGRKPLRELDEITIEAISQCKGYIDTERALSLWNELMHVSPWDGNPVWIHSDLLKPNLLVNNGKLSAVIDFGGAGIGDPAFDLSPAWAVFTSKARRLYKKLLTPDENAWHRAKAYALHQAALIIPYYYESNPAFTEQAKNTIENILD